MVAFKLENLIPAGAAVLGAVTMASCVQGDGAERTPVPAPAQVAAASPARIAPSPAVGGLHAGPAIDLQAVMRHVHFAYHPADTGFDGGHTTYAVSVSRDGKFSVTPYHYPRAALPSRVASRVKLLVDPSRQEYLRGTAAEFQTVTVARGQTVLAGAISSQSVSDEGALVIARGAVSENLRNDEDGVEQSWSFATRPEGTGDLVVRIRTSGMDYAGETTSGLHLVDKTTGLGLRYGVATFIDARGHETTVRGRFERGEIVLAVPAVDVDAAAYPARLDPLIGPEFGMDTPVSAPAYGYQANPAIDTDGSNYFVVWSDARAGSSVVFGTRVTAAGSVEDTNGIKISAGGNYGDSVPQVAYGAGTYMVTWSVMTSIMSEYEYYSDIAAARVTPAGVLSDPTPIVVANVAGTSENNPKIAFNGTNFLIVWEDTRNVGNSMEVYGARVAPTGSNPVMDAAGIGIATAAQNQYEPTVASNGSVWGVAYRDDSTGAGDIYMKNVSADGTPSAAVQLTNDALTAEDQPNLVYGGGNYLLTYTNGSEIRSERVTTTPSVFAVDVGGRVVATAANQRRRPHGAYDPSLNKFFVVWEDCRTDTSDNCYPTGIFGARVRNSDGLAEDGSGIQITARQPALAPQITYGGAQYFAVWLETGGDDNNIFGARISSTGFVGDPQGVLITKTGNAQNEPAVTYGGGYFFVAFSDNRNASNGTDIYGVRIDSTGTVKDPSGIAIRQAANQQLHPAVGFAGGTYLVTWTDFSGNSYDIHGARVLASNGALQDVVPKTIASSTANSAAAVSSDGTNFLVAWPEAAGTPAVKAQRYDGTFTPVGGQILVGSCSANCGQASVAYGSDQWLVAWSEYSSDCSPIACPSNIVGARVATTGAVMGPINIAFDAARPRLASDGTDFLVVWNDGLLADTDVHGAKVNAAGTVSGTLDIITNTETSNPDIAYDGWQYLVAWQDVRNARSDIYGAVITKSGAMSGAITSLSGLPENEWVPAIAADKTTGQGLLTYTRFDATTDIQALRVKGRLLSAGGVLGASCSQGSSCSSGICVDGVCCDAPCGGGVADCQACDATGHCTAGGNGSVCRPATGPCDIEETCSAGTCPADQKQPDNTPCPNATLCDGNEVCQGGVCTAGTPLDCVDTNPCTTDSCNPTGACQHTQVPDGTGCPNSTACDGNETCQSGACRPGAALDCNDGDPCTTDSCDAVSGCRHSTAPNGTPCTDGSVCTQGDSCQSGVCQPGAQIDCDDGKVCTTDTCDAASGCVHTNVPNTTTCDDNNPCNTGDHCQDGVCLGASGLNCDDDNPCTIDGCDPGPPQTCTHVAVAANTPCNDGDLCKTNKTCSGSTCSGGTAIDCSDSNQCTTDTCAAATGCAHAPANGTTCVDGDPCTGDTCVGDVCTGTAKTCAPSDECHESGVCDAQTGACSNPAKNDGEPCTGGVCLTGTCTFDTDAGVDAGNDGSGATGGGGGAVTTGGAAGAGGGASGSSGSAAATGGTGVGGRAGSGIDAGAGTSNAAQSERGPGGCSCRAAGSSESSETGVFAAVLAGLFAAGLRRRRSGAAAARRARRYSPGIEAVDMVVRDDVEPGRDPFEGAPARHSKSQMHETCGGRAEESDSSAAGRSGKRRSGYGSGFVQRSKLRGKRRQDR